MERQLPTVKIGGTDFIVDIQNKEFREAERISNKIPFSKIYNHPDSIAINYDKTTRNVYEGDWISFLHDRNTESVHLPPLIELDPIGTMGNGSKTELYDYSDQLSRQHQSSNEKSIARILPKVDILGTEYFLDMRLAEFRKVDNPLLRIPLSELFVIKGDTIGLIYDPLTKRAFSGTREQYELRNDLRLIEIPSLVKINEDTTGRIFKTLSHSIKDDSLKQHQQQPIVKRKGRGL